MPKITTCLLDGKPLSIGEALTLRDAASNSPSDSPPFRCDECGDPVQAHKEANNGGGAHFEHKVENSDCPYFQ